MLTYSISPPPLRAGIGVGWEWGGCGSVSKKIASCIQVSIGGHNSDVVSLYLMLGLVCGLVCCVVASLRARDARVEIRHTRATRKDLV